MMFIIIIIIIVFVVVVAMLITYKFDYFLPANLVRTMLSYLST